MYLLPCSHCDASVPITTSQAGGAADCPACHAQVEVPTLGKVRQLPMSESGIASEQKRQAAASSGGGSIGFLVLGMIATAALVIAGFCGIRWFLIDVPLTTQTHIAEYEKAYQGIEPAKLVREYEQMEKYPLDLVPMYTYKKTEQTKADWGRSAAIAGGVGLLAAIGAFLAGTANRKRD